MSTTHEYIAGPEGVVNRKRLTGSPPGEVITYFLSEEERQQLIEKYGPILRKRPQRPMHQKTIEPQLTKEQYLAYKKQGLSDEAILKLRLPGLTCAKLVRLKTRWGIRKDGRKINQGT